MPQELSFAEKLKARQARQQRADTRETETDEAFRARVRREMTDPAGTALDHAAGAGLHATRRRPPPPGPASLPVDGAGAYARAPSLMPPEAAVRKIQQEVKGVSAGAVSLPGLFTSGDARPTTVKLNFSDCGRPRPEDLDRIASELACGVFAYGALPWLSLESTCDRGAKRLSTLHPCYRGTLIGRVCLEMDVALKAVGGTAHGGLFLDCTERDTFLDKECASYNWGPNAQREWPQHLRGPVEDPLKTIIQNYPSFRTSDAIFGDASVRDWKREWERKWDGDATGADVKAQLEQLDVCASEDGGRRTLHARASIPWSVAIHASSGSKEAQDVARQGEILCQKLLPRVPIPVSSPNHWRPPATADKLAYFVSLLRCAAALSSILLAAKRDTDLVPYALLARFFENTGDMCATPRWLPFEPAVDDQSGAAFVGGGVSVGGAAAKVVWAEAPPPAQLNDAAYVLDLAPRVQAPDADDMLTAVAASTAQASCVFMHEVVALGLGDTYARAHPSAPLPDRSSLTVPLGGVELAQLLVELFPERYCRRLRLGRSLVASTVLRRPDAAEALAELCGDASVAKAEETERTALKERVVLFNGDVHDGHWLFGRKHGAGTYGFVSGAKFEGKWDVGKMVGIGWYTKDGKRNLVDLRKKS